MDDQYKTNEELVNELKQLRKENSELRAIKDKFSTEKKQENNLLQQTRNNYESFFNTINDFLFVLDEQGRIIHANDTVYKRLGYSKEELSDMSVLMVHPEERRDEAARIVRGMLEGSADFCPVPIITKSGIQIPVETRVTSGVWDGKPVIFGVTKDISDLKLSEERFSKVFYLNPSLCGLSDLKTGKYVEVNDKFHLLLGFEKDEVIGKTAIELGILSPQSYKSVAGKADVNGKINNIETDLKAKNGEIKHVLMSAENIYIQDKKFRFTVINDITELKKAENEINRQASIINSLINSIPDLIFIKDINGVYLGCNDPFAELVDKSVNEIIGKTDYDLFDKDSADSFRDYDQSMLDTKKSKQNEEWITYKDGRRKLIDTLKTPYWGPNGTLVGILGISRDITDRKNSEDEIRQKNAELIKVNLEKDKFFSIIAHDLRSPFNGFLGLTEVLAVDLPNLSMNQIQEFVINIRKSATNLYRLLNNLLEWAQIQKGSIHYNPTINNLLLLIDECLSLSKESAKAKNINIVIDIDEDLKVFADKNMLQTIIRNLVSNAIKFTPEGGDVILSASINNENHIKFTVKDSGIGMSQSMIDDLFRIDVKSSRKGTQGELGTGLGLLLCKEFIEKHGGRIWVESIVGTGTTFHFTLQ
jgi:PAS domain S-box-containing protein